MSQTLFTLTARLLDGAERPPVTVVEVSGEIDLTNAAEFGLALAAADGPRPLVTDLSGLSYIDSAGFAVLDRLLTQGGIAIVSDSRSPVHAAAMLVDLPCHENLTEALAALAT